ncbi:hypothetical protein [Parapedobacter luteus]|nr:hypothetical protein [Parapedobacter luteus]
MLITQGTQPFAQRVANRLPAGQRQHMVFGSADGMPQALLSLENYLEIPKANAPAFAHEMLKICLDRNISALIPLGVNELYPLSEARQLFSEYGIAVWVPALAELAAVAVIKNPPKQLPLLLLLDGKIAEPPTVGDKSYGTLSGVFTQLESGDELALCCVGD